MYVVTLSTEFQVRSQKEEEKEAKEADQLCTFPCPFESNHGPRKTSSKVLRSTLYSVRGSKPDV